MSHFSDLIMRELQLAWSQGASLAIGVVFFMALVILFPFGIGPDLGTLSLVAPAILWAGPLLAVLLGIERLFQPDEDDGTMDIYRMSDLPMILVILAKSVAAWISSVIPLLVIAPLFGMMLGMTSQAIFGCVIALFVGSPSIVFFGVLCGALTSQVRRSGMLTAILAVPLLVPTLIFGVSASVAFATPKANFVTPLLILIALSLVSALIGVWGSAMIMRGDPRA